MGNCQSYFNQGITREQGGLETSLMDPSKVESKTGKENYPNPSLKQNSPVSSVDIGNKRSLPDKKKFEKHKEFFETELKRLNLCIQRIATLNTKLAPESIEHELRSRYLTDHLSLSKEVLKLMKGNELLLLRDLEISLGALAVQNGVIATICAEIKEFETKAVKSYQVPLQGLPIHKGLTELKMLWRSI